MSDFHKTRWAFAVFAVSAILAATCVSTSLAGEQPATPTVDELVRACQSAKDAFAPRTEAHLGEAKTNLLAAVSSLDRKLRASGPNAEGWRKFLRWDDMQKQLNRQAGPDLSVLDEVYARYASGQPGLELAAFVDVRQNLRRYLTTARAIGNERLVDQYKGLLDALAKQLEAYASEPSTDRALVIGEAVRWLEDAGQAPELIAQIRRHFSQPNLFVQVSAEFIAAGISAPVDTKGPLTDVILGTRISGTEHTTGQVVVELIPRQEFAEIDTVFRGTSYSDTVGVNGPARVGSKGVTRIAARKAIRIDADKVWTLPTRSNAVTATTITSVQTTRGGAMVAQTARQQVYSQKAQSERIAAEHAEQRTNRRIDQQADEQIGKLADNYQKRFRRPLLDRGLFPQLLRFYTSEAALFVTALHGGTSGLAAPAAPPEVEGEHALTVRLHDSVLNNFAGMALAGMIVEEDRLREELTDILGSTPAWLEPDEESQPWTITFAQRRPVTLTVTDGGFTVTLRGSEYIRGGSSYPGMDVTAVYKLAATPEGPRAIRQGGLQVYPPGFSPGQQLSAREQILRTLLEKRFSKMFPEQMVPEPLVLKGEWEKAGQLVLEKWDASAGWMTMCWKRVPAPEKPQ